ncbi:MAG: dienelactone hydrolase family protein, partial [Bacteroidetes bacterium]
GKDTVSGYLCLPDHKGVYPAVILIHEWWGMNDWVKENAKTFAMRGYAALAIDLYRGKVAKTPDEAHEIMRGLPEDRTLRDLKAAFQYLKLRPETNDNKIGVIGWCMGGGYSLMSAVNITELSACVICYGRLVTDSTSINAINAPLLGIFGEADRGIDPNDVRQFEKDARAMGKNVEMILYPNARHAFMNPNNDAGYSAASASDAWKRVFEFFDSTLTK